MLHQFFHWFAHELTPWVTGVAQAHPIWCFPIAFVVAFSESFVGVSFIIPGTFLLVALGRGDRRQPHQCHSGLGRRGDRLGPGRLDLVLDWISLSSPNPAYLAVPPLRSAIGKGPALLPPLRHLGDIPGPLSGPFRATVPLVAGMSELEFWPFQIANTASALIWAFVILDAGNTGELPCGVLISNAIIICCHSKNFPKDCPKNCPTLIPDWDWRARADP